MTKSIDVLPTWYWPDGVPRRGSLPDVTIADRLIRRWARRRGDDEALVARGETIDFAGLDRRTSVIAGRLERRAGGTPARLAVATDDAISGALALFGALRAGAQVLLAPADPAVGVPAIEGFGADLVATDAVGAGVPSSADRIELDVLVAGAGEGEPPGEATRHDPRRPAVTLIDGARLAHHSEVSILRAGHAFAAFFSLGARDRVRVDRPAGTWEQIVGLLGALEVGAAFVATDVTTSAAAEVTVWWTHVADVPHAADDPPRWLRPGSTVLVSVDGPMPVRLRRRLRRALHARVLTVFGAPATGLIAASAPAWQLDEAIGIPVTDVDMIPVDPKSRTVAAGPWVLLDHAGVAVRTPALAPGIEGDAPGAMVEDAYYTGAVGRIDANGMLYLL
jgi:hypothetical protein